MTELLAYASLALHALLIALAVWLCHRYAPAFKDCGPACLLKRKTEARYWSLMASILTSVLCMASVGSCLLAERLQPGHAGGAMTLALNVTGLAGAALTLFHLQTWREMRRRYDP